MTCLQLAYVHNISRSGNVNNSVPCTAQKNQNFRSRKRSISGHYNCRLTLLCDAIFLASRLDFLFISWMLTHPMSRKYMSKLKASALWWKTRCRGPKISVFLKYAYIWSDFQNCTNKASKISFLTPRFSLFRKRYCSEAHVGLALGNGSEHALRLHPLIRISAALLWWVQNTTGNTDTEKGAFV